MASSTAAKMRTKMGWLRHVLTALSVLIFLLGCVIIGYMAWVLATSVTVSQFLDGSLIFTYVVITLGFILFFSGLFGWVGGASESPCLIVLFLVSVIVSIAAEIGGIICLSVIQLEFDQILQSGWNEVNQGTRNLVQNNLDCCGWNGPKDFATSNDPIDSSCYEEVRGQAGNRGVLPRLDLEDQLSAKKMKSDACGPKLFAWFQDNKITWVTILASVAAVQVMCVGISIYIISRVRKQQSNRRPRTLSRRHLYETSSSEDSREFRKSRI